MRPRVGYLSGAPRVSTRPDAHATGPRAHAVVVIEALKAYGFTVYPFIVGDRVSRKWTGAGSAQTLHHSRLVRLAADVARLALRWANSRRARNVLDGKVDWVYERFGIFQALG